MLLIHIPQNKITSPEMLHAISTIGEFLLCNKALCPSSCHHLQTIPNNACIYYAFTAVCWWSFSRGEFATSSNLSLLTKQITSATNNLPWEQAKQPINQAQYVRIERPSRSVYHSNCTLSQPPTAMVATSFIDWLARKSKAILRIRIRCDYWVKGNIFCGFCGFILDFDMTCLKRDRLMEM